MDFAALNRVLKEVPKTLKFFDKLPADDPRRKVLGSALFPQLLEAKRYTDAAKAQPYEQISRMFTAMRKVESMQDPSKVPERLRQLLHENQVTWLANHIEMLAGAGQILEAKELLAAALNYDHSDEATAAYRSHLKRAGHPELMETSAPAAEPKAGAPTGKT